MAKRNRKGQFVKGGGRTTRRRSKSRALARRGTTLLVSSHVMDEADHCADLLLMREGRLLAHTTPNQLREDTGCTSLEEAFLSVIRHTTAVPAG